MSLLAGTRLGPYEIEAPLGAGGQGEVYRARDTRLRREVAIKVLAPHLAADPDRRARFEREAEAISSLNHPHICVLHDVGRDEGIDYLVMELVEGETLLHRLTKGPLPLEKTLRYGIEIADALDKAHRRGVIHRDLKPGNVMLTRSGSKLMDFGLAKRAPPGDSGQGLSALPTQEKPLTDAGSLLGTFQYMSPEQLEGREADARSDIWALGLVLYEMATGKRAFSGKSQASLIGAILKDQPQPMREQQPLTPTGLERLVKVCLAKDPDDRLQTSHDVMQALRWIGEEATDSSPAREGRISSRIGLTHAVSLLIGAGLAGLLMWRGADSGARREATSTTIKATLRLPEGQRLSRMMYPALALSPDGTKLAYTAQESTGRRLHVRSLDRFDSTPLAGTEDASMPFFSPDGQWLGFIAGGKLKRIALSGGAALTIATAPEAVGASWGDDGTIVFSPTSGSGLWRVSSEGGVPEQLTKPDYGEHGNGHVWPQVLPGSKKVVFTVWGRGAAVLDVATREWRTVLPQAYGVLYSRSGHLLFTTSDGGGGLFAVPFDAASAAVSGASVPIAERVSAAVGFVHPHAAVSETGTLVFLEDVPKPRSLLWVDRAGRPEPIWTSPNPVTLPRLSPDGTRVVFIDTIGSIWSLDLHRRVERVLAKAAADAAHGNPVWMDGGARLALCSTRPSNWDIYELAREGGEPQPVLARPGDQCPESWARSAKGPLLAFIEWHPANGTDLWLLPAEGVPAPIATSAAREEGAALSPDGRYLAYVSDASGRDQVYVRVLETAQTLLVSGESGTEPLWSREGRELFYRSGDRLMVAALSPGPEIGLSPPEPLFEFPFEHAYYENRANYDISDDDRRFLVPSDSSTFEVQLVLNWTAALREQSGHMQAPKQ